MCREDDEVEVVAALFCDGVVDDDTACGGDATLDEDVTVDEDATVDERRVTVGEVAGDEAVVDEVAAPFDEVPAFVEDAARVVLDVESSGCCTVDVFTVLATKEAEVDAATVDNGDNVVSTTRVLVDAAGTVFSTVCTTVLAALAVTTCKLVLVVVGRTVEVDSNVVVRESDVLIKVVVVVVVVEVRDSVVVVVCEDVCVVVPVVVVDVRVEGIGVVDDDAEEDETGTAAGRLFNAETVRIVPSLHTHEILYTLSCCMHAWLPIPRLAVHCVEHDAAYLAQNAVVVACLLSSQDEGSNGALKSSSETSSTEVSRLFCEAFVVVVAATASAGLVCVTTTVGGESVLTRVVCIVITAGVDVCVTVTIDGGNDVVVITTRVDCGLVNSEVTLCVDVAHVVVVRVNVAVTVLTLVATTDRIETACGCCCCRGRSGTRGALLFGAEATLAFVAASA